MIYKFQCMLLYLLDRCYGLERLGRRAGLSAEDARRVARYQS